MRSLRLMVLIAIFALIAAACSSSSEEATTTAAGGSQETATTAAGGSEEATTTVAGGSEEATTTVPTASETKVALVPGGPHPYFAPWEQAAADAKAELGLVDASYEVPDEWSVDVQNQLIQSLVVRGYNAFVIFPGDANVTAATVGDLMAEDIPVIAAGGCVNDPSDTVLCLATDVGASAYQGTENLIEAMGGSGNIVHLTGYLVDPNTQLRIDAVEKAVADAGGDLTVIQTITDIDDAEAATEAVNNLLAARAAEIDGIITTAYQPTVAAAKGLETLGENRIKMVGIDDDPSVLEAIESGVITGTMAQNPYGQGFLGAYVLDKLVSYGCTIADDAPFITTDQTSRFVDSGTLFISKDNVKTYGEELVELTKQLQTAVDDEIVKCG